LYVGLTVPGEKGKGKRREEHHQQKKYKKMFMKNLRKQSLQPKETPLNTKPLEWKRISLPWKFLLQNVLSKALSMVR
jgi:hypothetical protein